MNAYRAVLAVPGARWFVIAAFVGRLPMSMLGLGTIVLVQSRTGSYGLAGAVIAVAAACFAVAAPVAGRVADRAGQARVLLASLAAHLAGLVAAAAAGGPRWALFAAAVPAGAAFPQGPAMVRARWAALLAGDPAAVQTAYALESVLDEVICIAGPVIVVTLATRLFPAAGLAGAAVLVTAGTVWFAALRATEPTPRPGRRGRPRAIAAPGLRVLAGVFALTGAIFGTVEVAMVAFTTSQGARALAGPLLAAYAVGSLLAGLWYGARDWHAQAPRRFLAALTALAAGTVLFAAATTIPQMAAAALLAGCTVSPALIAGFTLTERLLPGDVLTEGFAWLDAATGIGLAAGYSAGGLATTAAGPRAAFLAAAVAALLAAGAATLGRRWLRTPPSPSGEHPVALACQQAPAAATNGPRPARAAPPAP